MHDIYMHCNFLHPVILRYCNIGNASSFTLSVEQFPPGDYNFTIDARDVFGQTATVVVELFLSGNNRVFPWYISL
jgi:hypothetical protein